MYTIAPYIPKRSKSKHHSVRNHTWSIIGLSSKYLKLYASKIHAARAYHTANFAVCTFHGQYSLTDSSMWLFPAYAMLAASVSFWSRAKAKDSYSMLIIMCESLLSRILYIIKSCTIDSIAPTNSFPSSLVCLSRGAKFRKL